MLIDPFEKDRAGASSNQRVQTIVNGLQSIHKFVYAGKDIVWRMWANEILSKDVHSQESLMHEPPSPGILRFMTLAEDNAQVRLRNARDTMSVASNISETYNARSSQVQTYVDEAIKLQAEIEAMMARLKVVLTLVQTHNNSLNDYSASNIELLQNLAPAISQPTESQFSIDTYNNINNMEDVDHAL